MSFVCNLCEREFEFKQSLDYHKNKQVCENKNFVCKYCGNLFSTKNSMYVHISRTCKVKNIVHNENDKKSCRCFAFAT